MGHTKYKDVEELELLCTAEENVKWYHCFGRVSSKVKLSPLLIHR